jgi:hypothetical protein
LRIPLASGNGMIPSRQPLPDDPESAGNLRKFTPKCMFHITRHPGPRCIAAAFLHHASEA